MASGDDTPLYPVPIFFEGIDDVDTEQKTANRGGSQGRSRGRSRGKSSRGQRGRGRGEDNQSLHLPPRIPRENNQPNTRYNRGNPNSRSRGRGRGRDRSLDRRSDQNVRENKSIASNESRLAGMSDFENDGALESIDCRNQSEKVRRPREFSETNLISLSKKDNPDEVLLDIGNSKSGFVDFIRKPLDPHHVYYIIRLLCNVSDAKMQDARRREILQEVEMNFLHKLSELLNLVSLKDSKTFQVWNSSSNLSKLLINISNLLRAIITTLPSSLGKCKGVITAVKEIIEEHAVEGVSEAIEDVEEVLKREKQTKENSRKEGLKSYSNSSSSTDNFLEEMKDPPNDFRKISIFPSIDDLQEDVRPFLRANKDLGQYDNLDTYLDVQFRLLREDYMQPLRKGISDYRHCIKEGIAVTKLRDIRLYQSVQIVHPVCSGRGINHMLQFDIKNFTRVNWASSRRLLYGSLVCLSKDNFDTIVYATITERDTDALSQGNIQVYFENKSDLLDIKPTDVFIMAETTAYFEAYRHVLEGLKEMDDTMPLQRYVISCETVVQPPEYLKRNKSAVYDFSCVLHKTKRHSIIPVLQTELWHSASELNLDPSQYEALQQAMTKELAVIQGPPGTGKTFVGLKIVQLLLNNVDQWTEPKQRCPILIVCYTNHALDQFLEGVSQFSKSKIIRIGGRCKNENLQPYILRNIKQKRKENKERSFSMTQSERDYRNELKNSETVIDIVSNKLKQTSTNVVIYANLKEFMTDSQQKMFEMGRDEQSLKKCLSEWIGIFEKPEESTEDGKTIGQKFQQAWEETILQKVRELPKNERDSIICVWDLDTGRRAELYKTWIADFTNDVQNSVLETSQEELDSRKRNVNIEVLIQKAKETILDIETLLCHVVNPLTRQEIQSLFAGRCVSTSRLIHYWLDLLGNAKSIPYIKEALINISANDESKFHDKDLSDDEEDLEEDRQLDEDDNFLYDYSVRKNKTKGQDKIDDNDWISNVNAKQTAYRVKMVLSSAKKLKQEEAERMTNVWKLENTKRRDLYAHWVLLYRQKLKETVKVQEMAFNNATEKLEEVRNMETVEILKDADIIGMTTTGAAKYRRLLKLVRPKIIVVEEAAEVLESHIITTLNENCQHLILIGDHKQLRPSTTVYELSRKYKMDVSLFERMVRNKVPCVTLQEQHRMRPEISCLLRHERLYPTLRDHDSVKTYDSIMGVDVNVQFIDHDEPEQSPEDSTSHCNPHEANYIARLCMYLLCQGYSPSQITVITPYMAQVLLLRRVMPKSTFEGVRITAVDNFQGEENDIILLSLVRSSSSLKHGKNKIGFVGIENRICVSLSRAKRGLYVMGNFKLLEQNSELWHDIINQMRRNGAVRLELTLRCQNHPEKFVLAKEAKDFEKCPQGGCGRSCDAELPCGHICPKSCHQVDKNHERATCERPCEKIVCDQGHKCTKRCWKDCGECCTIVEKIVPLCGHKTPMKCYIDPNSWNCRQICTFTLPCGHKCNRKCYECKKSLTHEENCQETVEKILPCQHMATMKCHQPVEDFDCKEPCDAILDCKHKCKGNCSSCLGGRIHGSCTGTCNKILPCGHVCSNPCGELCPPCNRPCNWKCSHGIPCTNKCWQECNKCTEKCKFSCIHRKCDQECHEICSNRPCQERCNKKLQCGHICRGLCGEMCICSECKDSFIRRDFGEEFDEGAVFLQLPDCRCIFEIHRLDRYMNTTTISRRGDLCKTCPHCSKPVKDHIRRYTNVLKQIRAKIADKFRAILGSDSERQAMAKQLQLQILGLQKLGLTDSEAKVLLTSIRDITKFGVLHVTNQAVDRLKILLQIEKMLTDCRIDIARGDCLIKPAFLRDILVHVKKVPTRQFWTEVSTEIKRLKLGIVLKELKTLGSLSNQTGLQEMVDLAIEVLSGKTIDSNKEACLKEVNGVVKTFLDTRYVDNYLVTKVILQLKAQRKLPDTTKQIKEDNEQGIPVRDNYEASLGRYAHDRNAQESTELETDLSTRNKRTSDTHYERKRNIAIESLKEKNTHEDSNISYSTSMARQNITYSTQPKQTQHYELALGSDSIDSIEPSTRIRSKSDLARDILFGSDSIDSLPVIRRSENTRRQAATATSLSDDEEVYDNDFGTLV